jgi:hypothetical protein
MVGGSLQVLRLLPPLKTGRHDIAEILLKVALKHKKSIKSITVYLFLLSFYFYIFLQNKYFCNTLSDWLQLLQATSI